MLNSNEEILADIDHTLTELAKVAAALKKAKTNHHFVHEVEHLEHLQESLLARLKHRQSLLEKEKKKPLTTSIRKEAIERKFPVKRRSQKRLSLRRACSKS